MPGPFGGVAAEAVGKDEGEAVAVAFVVDVDAVEKGGGHGGSSDVGVGGQYSIVRIPRELERDISSPNYPAVGSCFRRNDEKEGGNCGTTKRSLAASFSSTLSGPNLGLGYQLGPGLDPAQGDGRHLPEPDG